MHEKVPLRGGRDKHLVFVQFLLEALTKLGVVMLDKYASMSICKSSFSFSFTKWSFLWRYTSYSSTKVCKHISCHIVAYEGDKVIFDVIIFPLCVVPSPPRLQIWRVSLKLWLNHQRQFFAIGLNNIYATFSNLTWPRRVMGRTPNSRVPYL